MTGTPTPLDLAKFAARPANIAKPTPVPSPTGWTDGDCLTWPLSNRHHFLDTGIYHSLAALTQDEYAQVLAAASPHEENATITEEVLTQNAEPLRSRRIEIGNAASVESRRACSLAVDTKRLTRIRNQLIAEAQLRRPADPIDKSKHGGEAELILLALQHEPAAVLTTNDAGASAVAKKNAVPSCHFGHLARLLVAHGYTPEEALSLARRAFTTSKLNSAESQRTLNLAWFT